MILILNPPSREEGHVVAEGVSEEMSGRSRDQWGELRFEKNHIRDFKKQGEKADPIPSQRDEITEWAKNGTDHSNRLILIFARAHSPPQAVPPRSSGDLDQEPGRAGSGVVGSRVW